jgi:glycosyltransferase involved in cell wall biosynthesis
MRGELPVITVLMATYNDERYIVEAVRSILSQTMRDFEFLVIDDASTDGTSSILCEYAMKDSRMRVFTNESNLGLTKSLNIGLRLARGKYIARMDGDDISYPERLVRQYLYMINNPECSILATDGILIGKTGKRIKEIRINFCGLSQKEYLLNYGSPFLHSSMIFSKQKVLELGGYDETLKTRQDLELWLRAIYSGLQISVLNEQLIKLRFHSNSLSQKGFENLYLNVIITALYRTQDLGLNVERGEIENLVKKNPMIRSYIQRVLARKRSKAMIDYFISGQLIKGIAFFLRTIPCLPLALRGPVRLLPVIDLMLENTQRSRQCA